MVRVFNEARKRDFVREREINIYDCQRIYDATACAVEIAESISVDSITLMVQNTRDARYQSNYG